jgi:hypothetical protein
MSSVTMTGMKAADEFKDQDDGAEPIGLLAWGCED